MINRMGRNDKCWCGSNLKYKKCCSQVDDLIRHYISKGYILPSRSILKTKSQIDGIRRSGKVNMEVLDFISDYIKPEINTEEINQLVNGKSECEIEDLFDEKTLNHQIDGKKFH